MNSRSSGRNACCCTRTPSPTSFTYSRFTSTCAPQTPSSCAVILPATHAPPSQHAAPLRPHRAPSCRLTRRPKRCAILRDVRSRRRHHENNRLCGSRCDTCRARGGLMPSVTIAAGTADAVVTHAVRRTLWPRALSRHVLRPGRRQGGVVARECLALTATGAAGAATTAVDATHALMTTPWPRAQ